VNLSWSSRLASPPAAGRRRGAALAGAIMALVCLSVLLSAMAFAAREEQLIGIAARDAERAFTSAERAAWTAVAAFVPADTALEIGSTREIPVSAAPADTIAATVTRLAPALLLATGEAAVRTPGGAFMARRVGIFARFIPDTSGGGAFEPLPERAWAELP
jgi:hypothetical protein